MLVSTSFSSNLEPDLLLLFTNSFLATTIFLKFFPMPPLNQIISVNLTKKTTAFILVSKMKNVTSCITIRKNVLFANQMQTSLDNTQFNNLSYRKEMFTLQTEVLLPLTNMRHSQALTTARIFFVVFWLFRCTHFFNCVRSRIPYLYHCLCHTSNYHQNVFLVTDEFTSFRTSLRYSDCLLLKLQISSMEHLCLSLKLSYTSMFLLLHPAHTFLLKGLAMVTFAMIYSFVHLLCLRLKRSRCLKTHVREDF